MVDLATCFKFFAGVEDARFDLWLDFLAAPGFGVEFGFVADLASLFVHVVDVAETCFFGFDEFCEEHRIRKMVPFSAFFWFFSIGIFLAV